MTSVLTCIGIAFAILTAMLLGIPWISKWYNLYIDWVFDNKVEK